MRAKISLILSLLIFGITPLMSNVKQPDMNTHTLKPLPFAGDALEPKISRKTFDFHWGKHLAAYVNNYNKLKQNTPFDKLPLVEAIKKAEGGLYNNAAQVFNHEFYFEQMTDRGATHPSTDLKTLITDQFGSMEKFRQDFTTSALSVFGSGWVWLVIDINRKLTIMPMANAGNPLREELRPLMVIDVWEHAYYLDYQNRRADYIDAFWDVMDWNVISDRLRSVEQLWTESSSLKW